MTSRRPADRRNNKGASPSDARRASTISKYDRASILERRRNRDASSEASGRGPPPADHPLIGGNRRQDVRADVPLRVQFDEVVALRGRRDQSLARPMPGVAAGPLAAPSV